ncbi:MAG: two-component system sensor histidine kinase DegS [Cyclobacteriaceae bacterium]|jgi:signal transduction histidine kinase
MHRLKFKQLGLLYLFALGGIAASILISQLLIQTSISRQQDDARVINVAGRQRMLSQKISKLALKIVYTTENQVQNIKELQEALNLWKGSHEGLMLKDSAFNHHNSAVIKKLFDDLSPHFNIIYERSEKLILQRRSEKDLATSLAAILANEKDFLRIMDHIVSQYEREANTKVNGLQKTELYLFIISIIIILAELMFIFRPMARNIALTVEELVTSEEASNKMANQLTKLYDELGKSYQDLEAVNIQPKSPSLFARFDHTGAFIFFSSELKSLMEYEDEPPPTTFQSLLIDSGYRQDFINGLLGILKTGQNWTGELRLVSEPGDFCWIDAFLVPVKATSEIKFIAKDITEIKEAKIRSREINHERIEKIVKEQHYRSGLILEGQEEERKRLSRELHDGVGQMLSAMNLLLESLMPSSKPMQMRLHDAKDLMKSIIKEVRRVSFNLTPSSLDDFGLIPAINKFCHEINSVTKSDVKFINETSFINRLDSSVETNLYRIIQEAVNNALKYAKAQNIEVIFSHDINSLKISIRDDGNGFDQGRLESSGHFEKAGHGVFNMKERAAYIGGILKLDSKIGKGTNIVITLSLDKND